METIMEVFQRRLSQRIQAGTKTRYKLPAEQSQVETMLTQCYIGEMIKRGAKVGLSTRLDEPTRIKISSVSKWITGDYKTGLLLYGTVGSGKTTMATAICELISIMHYSSLSTERKGVARVSANTLVELRTAQDKIRSADNEYKFEHFKNAEMLFIDDIGIESATIKTWGNEFTPVIDLLYHRYDRQLFTIITSNLDNKGINNFYGERISDRFTEMFDTLSYINKSYRR